MDIVSSAALTLILSVLKGLSPDELVPAVAQGIATNRVLHSYKTLVTALGKSGETNTSALSRSLQRSVLLALQTLAADCRQDLIGPYPQQSRLQPHYPEHAAEIRWLNAKSKQLERDLQALEQGHAIAVPLPSLQIAQLLLSPESQQQSAAPSPTPLGRLIADARATLRQVALTPPPAILPDVKVPNYEARIDQSGNGLFEHICAFFAQEIQHNAAAYQLFSSQILVQIDARLSGQQLTLATVVQSLKETASAVSSQIPGQLNALEQGNRALLAATHRTVEALETLREDVKALREQSSPVPGQATPPVAPPVAPPVTSPVTPNHSVAWAANPFSHWKAGVLDDPALFFDRETEMQDIFERINSRSNVALIGECAIGKSSLLKAIERTVKAHIIKARTANEPLPRRPIYLDLQRVQDEADFCRYLCDEIGIARLESFGYLMARQLQKHYLLLLIDEVEKMTGNGFTPHIRGQLRSLASGRDAPLRLILAARTPLDKLFDDTALNSTSPLANVCTEVRLGPWREPIARAFIETRLHPTPIRFSPAAIDRLLQESQGHPQKLMQGCYSLYAQCLEAQR